MIGGDVNSVFDVVREKQQSVAEIRNLLRQCNFFYTKSSATRVQPALTIFLLTWIGTMFYCEVVPFPFSDHDALVVDLCNVRPKQDLGEM